MCIRDRCSTIIRWRLYSLSKTIHWMHIYSRIIFRLFDSAIIFLNDVSSVLWITRRDSAWHWHSLALVARVGLARVGPHRACKWIHIVPHTALFHWHVFPIYSGPTSKRENYRVHFVSWQGSMFPCKPCGRRMSAWPATCWDTASVGQ